jgi:hypothetical protein
MLGRPAGIGQKQSSALLAFEDSRADDECMNTGQPTCRRSNQVHAAYVNAALIIKQFDLRRAENMLIREGVPREVIARVILIGNPTRNVTPPSWAEQFCR